jgi:O-antigen ligase
MLEKLKQLYLNFSFIFPLLIAFLLPFGINYGIIIALWLICFFVFDDVQSGLRKLLTNKWSYIFIAFFVIHALGYFFSINKAEALSSIEIKLPFIFLPLLIFTSNFKELQLKKIVISFVSGCLILAFMCFLRAVYMYYVMNANAFFYSEFTYFLHPSYFAMYFVFAQLIVMLYYKTWLSHLKYLNLKIGFISLGFLVSIFLSSSKMGLIAAFTVLPITLFVLLINRGYKKSVFVLLVGLIAITGMTYKLFPSPFQRLQTAFTVTTSTESIDLSATESTAVRILIWRQAIDIIKENVVFGTTPGDANDALYQSYQKNGLTGATKKKLNAHNQFLQTFIGTGILGFILLSLMTVGAIIFGFLKKNYALILFSSLIVLNFLVESMLQAQAGFIFFTFFLCFLLQYHLGKFTNQNNSQLK